MAAKDKDISLKPLSVQKSYLLLAEELRRTIVEGQLPEGTRLPSERELVDQTGINRSSVREALRMLEVEGLLRSKPGRYGGNIVARPDNDLMAHFVGQFIRVNCIPVGSLQQARTTIEPALARLAAQNRNADDIETMDRICKSMADGPLPAQDFACLNTDWHNAVAAASKNELLAAFQYAMSHSVMLSTRGELFGEPDLQRAVCHVHERVVDAIRDKDPEEAERLMLRHIEASGLEVSRRTKEREVSLKSD